MTSAMLRICCFPLKLPFAVDKIWIFLDCFLKSKPNSIKKKRKDLPRIHFPQIKCILKVSDFTFFYCFWVPSNFIFK